MRLTVWTRRRLLVVLALMLVLDSVTTAAATMLLCSLRPWSREAAAPVPCIEDEAEDAVPALAKVNEIVFDVPAAQPLPSLSAEGTAAPEETPQSDERMLRVEVVHATQPPTAQTKRILIYHTHTWEAFQQVKDAPYQETEKWRSKDNSVNMVAVGDALTAALRALGFEVVHDTTAFEPPNLSDSYQRSLAMLEKRCEQGDVYDLYIDLHRDAFSSANAIKRSVKSDGETLARIMVLVGKGEGYAQKPDWQANLAIAECITGHLNEQVTDLGREVKIKTGRFNQHIASHCVLIECGCNYNTLQEVLSSMPYLAQAVADTLLEEHE